MRKVSINKTKNCGKLQVARKIDRIAIFVAVFAKFCKIANSGSGHHRRSSPPRWYANSSQNYRSCSFCSHKQRWWTVLFELWYEVASNLNTFFLSWKQRTAVKVVENALEYIKMYAAGVWAKTAKGYIFKMSKNKSFDVRARFGALYSASKPKKYLLKNNTIGNRLLF